MIKNIKIGTKITVIVVAAAFAIAVAISFVSNNFSKKSIANNYRKNLRILTSARESKIQNYIDHLLSSIQLIVQSEEIKKGLAQNNESTTASDFGSMQEGMSDIMFDETGDTADDTGDAFLMEDTMETDAADSGESPLFDSTPTMDTPSQAIGSDVSAYLNKIKDIYHFEGIFITHVDNGSTLFSTEKSMVGKKYPNINKILPKAGKKLYLSPVYINEKEHTYYFLCGAPIVNDMGEAENVIFFKINVKNTVELVQDTLDLGKTGEILLVSLDSSSQRVLYLNPLRNQVKSDTLIPPLYKNCGLPVQEALAGNTGTGDGKDYRGQNVLASWTKVPYVHWGIITKIDTDEVYSDVNERLFTLLFYGSIIILFSLIASIIFSKRLIGPLLSLKSTLELISRGSLPERVLSKSKDEIGMMAGTVNNLVNTLKDNANFAQQIGEGNFDANFTALSDDDILGTALINMRDNLIETEKRDKERNWIVTGVAEISEILRMHDNLEALGDDVIRFIINKINAVQGAFYVVDNDDDIKISLKSCHAYNRKKYLNMTFKFAEGLVGQSVAEQNTILRTEIPEDYVTITSGLIGESKPTAILIVPLITNEEVYGVMEFAGFNKFNSGQVKFVEELSLILARTVFNIKVNERTRKLLAESTAMSNELQEKQEVLRQNAEEMQATQEELKRSNTALEDQVEEVNRTQKRMQLLLENASEVITIYEEDETIRYISPSVEPILGYTQEEMINTKDVSNVHEDKKDIFENMFERLISGEQQLTIQYEYKTSDDHYIWLESTGTNFLSDPAIHGIIVNSRDITERRRAEQEQRMRSKMQALSENSPDLITRVEQNGPISYINPIIETYTGVKPVEFLNKTMEDSQLSDVVVHQWSEILERVNSSSQKVATEMDFPSEMGDRVMQVNAIPEFDEENELESVLVVSHDITDSKIIELEIKSKNKKINDSINYAKRIQGAILPNNAIINRTLNDSFILYKPKDVVSGDFPWYIQVGGNIFIAAVDCTGHGVPGALLSLIGYFLLNDIVRSRKISDPGIILDQLDDGVTQTLRQDEDDSKTKDGMDIALCKINLEKNEVAYAGAHRPLYLMKNGEMEEVKGNKFAIGGGIYKNQTNFTTTTHIMQPGDSIYFCSDGFPDQFGGPSNRKFGPKRLRELIRKNHNKSMKEAYAIFNDAWEDWQGDYKQTDDVLLIGIKF